MATRATRTRSNGSPRASRTRSVEFIDVTLRDAHQCLWSTRMTTEMMTPILGAIDRCGYAYINILGGAVFDVCVRFLRENPWQRISALTSRLSTPCDGLTRGQSLYTFELFPDDVVALNMQRLAAHGIARATVYDALNDNRNLESSITAAHACGMTVNAMVVYAVSPVHDDAYFAARVRELVALGADTIALKDPSGLLLPERAATLLPAFRAAAGTIPVELHSHCQSGRTVEVYAHAVRAGFSFLQTATTPLAHGASLPPVEEVSARARELGATHRLDAQALREAREYFHWLALREGKPMGRPATFDPALWQHQVPGGMISNLRSQLDTMGMADRLPAILEETARVREDLGYPILVSPFAQYIVTQAVLNVVQGERYRTIPDEVKKYAQGAYGRLAARPSEAFLGRAQIEPGVLARERAGARIEPWLPRLRRELGPHLDDDTLLLHAFYPADLVSALQPQPASLPERTTPLAELVRYLAGRRDLARGRIRFAGTEISFGG
jgi:oxaloacetate decarboxylase (Na+ extruding) subunit alpha